MAAFPSSSITQAPRICLLPTELRKQSKTSCVPDMRIPLPSHTNLEGISEAKRKAGKYHTPFLWCKCCIQRDPKHLLSPVSLPPGSAPRKGFLMGYYGTRHLTQSRGAAARNYPLYSNLPALTIQKIPFSQHLAEGLSMSYQGVIRNKMKWSKDSCYTLHLHP